MKHEKLSVIWLILKVKGLFLGHTLPSFSISHCSLNNLVNSQLPVEILPALR